MKGVTGTERHVPGEGVTGTERQRQGRGLQGQSAGLGWEKEGPEQLEYRAVEIGSALLSIAKFCNSGVSVTCYFSEDKVNSFI